ncbi:Signal transduction histidine kinase [Bosea lupini]|uniref:histidine kinase n=1 Tax=Bosea lupini TaxID=1036779 RepID=A0A1H7ZG61_9HYPH|nr:Signal transduction histidine kinase [Bosea lupini]
MADRRRPSLARRLWLAAVIFVLIALLIAGVVIDRTLDRFTALQIDQRLDAQLLALASALTVGSDGAVRLRRDLDLPPYDRALSGWYWQVTGGDALLRSRSLGDATLALTEPVKGPRQEPLHLRHRTVRLASGSEPFELVAAAPREALSAPIRTARRTLAITLGALALALMGAVTAQVFLVLLPLRRLSRALADVRAGRTRSVPESQPAEVADLVVELNALLAQNADQAERARSHIGNLAHGLKTPLATLAAELRPGHDVDREALRALVEGMDRRIAHHLRRARSAALLGGRHFRTRLAPQIDDLVLALSKIHVDRSLRFSVSIPGDIELACDVNDVNEMCGNLLDNACKWAASEVAISAERLQHSVVISVRDDGVGISANAAEIALSRGGRLDEVTPGTGFGLPITREIAALYGGDVSLNQLQPGLLVKLTLPSAD